MKRILMLCAVIAYIAIFCPSTFAQQSVEKGIVQSINSSYSVKVYTKSVSDLKSGVTYTTVDREGRSWVFDVYSNKNEYTHYVIVQICESEWTVFKEQFALKNSLLVFATTVHYYKKIDIEQIQKVLASYVRSQTNDAMAKN